MGHANLFSSNTLLSFFFFVYEYFSHQEKKQHNMTYPKKNNRLKKASVP